MSVVNIYAPYRRSDLELQKTFVARQALLEELLRLLKAQWKRRTHQHVLLVGPRGIGKSHTLAMVCMHLGESPDELGGWLPVVFPQEAYGLLRLQQWVERWLAGAVEAGNHSDLDTEQLRQTQQQCKGLESDRAVPMMLASLRKWAREHKRKYLLLAENLDRLFGRRILKSDRDQKLLREILQHDRHTLLLATSPTRFKQLTSGAEPMYELFQIHTLEEFDREQMGQMLQMRAEYDIESGGQKQAGEAALRILRQQPGKVDTMYELTGGNPRIIEQLYRLVCSSREALHIEHEFLHLLEELTPYFQHRTDSLTDQQEEILMAVVQAGFQTTPTRIADATGIAVNTVTKQLRRLEELNFVATQKRRGKTTPYALQEKLYRYWLQYHEESTENLVRLIIDFLAAWYSRDELTAHHSKLYGDMENASGDLQRNELATAAAYFEAAREKVVEEETVLSGEITQLLRIVKDAPDGAAERRLEELVALAEEPLNVLLEWANAVHMRYARSESGTDFETANSLYQQLLVTLEERRRPWPEVNQFWVGWGLLFHDRWKQTNDDGDFASASHKYKKAANAKTDEHLVWFCLGSLFGDRWYQTHDDGDFKRTSDMYERAVAIRPAEPRTWFNWGHLSATAWSLNSDQEAASKADQCIEQFLHLIPDDPDLKLYRCQATAWLAALHSGAGNTLTDWTTDVDALPSLAGKWKLAADGAKFMAGHVPHEPLLDALLTLAENIGEPWEDTVLAPFIHALGQLTGRMPEALDRYPPEVLRVLAQVFTELEA